MSARRFLPGLIVTLLVAAVIVVLPLFLSDTHEYRFSFVATFFIAVLGLQILTGYAGLISLGHSGFMLIGAYVTTILSVDHGWNDLTTIPLAFVIAGVFGFLFGFPALRLRGVVPRARHLCDPDRADRAHEEVLGLHRRRRRQAPHARTHGSRGVCHNLADRGRDVRARLAAPVRKARPRLPDDPRVGDRRRIVRHQPRDDEDVAFGISAAFAGVAGSLYAIIIGFVNPDTFAIQLSILLLIGVVVGGLGSLAGVLAGALFIEYVPLYSPDILSWVENPFGSPLDPNRAGASAAVYGLVLLLISSWRRAEP